jgi:GH25 family lysozyme M1 (1,4-beta-N-acetylmuramidase)
MMTTVGFYKQNDDGTMDDRPIMVAKYPQPIMMRKDIDLILKIRIDI